MEGYTAKSGTLIPVFTLEVQCLPGAESRILDAVMAVNRLTYGRYERNASVVTSGKETAVPQANSTTSEHLAGFEPGQVETYEMSELKISIARDVEALSAVMDAILHAHPYEEPVIFVREDWSSRSNYDPHRNNPNRWWNPGIGLAKRAEL